MQINHFGYLRAREGINYIKKPWLLPGWYQRLPPALIA